MSLSLIPIYILWIHVVSKMSTQWYMISATIRQNMFYTAIKKFIFFKYIVRNKNIVLKNVYNFWVVKPYILYFSLIYAHINHSIKHGWIIIILNGMTTAYTRLNSFDIFEMTWYENNKMIKIQNVYFISIVTNWVWQLSFIIDMFKVFKH